MANQSKWVIKWSWNEISRSFLDLQTNERTNELNIFLPSPTLFTLFDAHMHTCDVRTSEPKPASTINEQRKEKDRLSEPIKRRERHNAHGGCCAMRGKASNKYKVFWSDKKLAFGWINERTPASPSRVTKTSAFAQFLGRSTVRSRRFPIHSIIIIVISTAVGHPICTYTNICGSHNPSTHSIAFNCIWMSRSRQTKEPI